MSDTGFPVPFPRPEPVEQRLTRLKVGDEGFLVASLIERCPKVMMLRELVRNAIEAAATAPEGARRVIIGTVPIDGVPKLSIRNSGRGMTADEIYRMADLAASIRKEQALDRNFGMGAKVAALPSNRLGMRYRSCHDGRVHEALLGWRDGFYGRVQQQDADGVWKAVLDVTALAIQDGKSVSRDWTEVVLLGNEPGQDTTRDPYAGEPSMPPHWLAWELAARFFRIGDGVTLRCQPAETPFEPIEGRLSRLATRLETVTLADGIRLHYAYDAPLADDPRTSRAGRESAYPVHGMIALVHGDELYDVKCHDEWLHVAPVFGIPFGARWVSVFIELPAGFPAVPDGYRQFLRFGVGRQDEIWTRHFASLVHAHRPGWLIALIEGLSPSARVGADIYESLDRLLRTLGVPRRQREIAGGRQGEQAAGVVVPAREAPAPPGQDGSFHAAQAGFDYEPAPEILLLRDPDEIAARAVVGRAGRYYGETHQLFLNATYRAVGEMASMLEAEFAWHPDRPRVASLSLSLSEQALAARVGRMLVFALSKQGDWPDHEIGQACSPHALSLAADDVPVSMPEAREAMRRAGALSPQPQPAAGPDSHHA